MTAHKHWVSRFSRNRIVFALAIFLVAFGVRALSWHDTRLEVGKVQTVVAENYKRVAQLLRQEGVRGFFSSSSELANPNHLGHPPGYSIFVAVIYSIFGESDSAVQFGQIFFDALCAVLIFLIVAELFSSAAALIAGLLAAVSPQLAWNAVLLLPDSLSVFPILLAIYLFVLARQKPRILFFIAAGVLVGISCWFRANAMLLTFFLAAAVLVCPTNLSLSIPQKSANLKFVGQRWRYSLAVIGATILIVAPLTIRNAIVFHRFIPVSLGAGQTLLEGIADYDETGSLNIPSTDMGIMKQESEMLQRPDYYGTLFHPDGVERERWRLRRGFAVIRSHPFWFAGVMVRRAGSMLKLERARLVSTRPAATHSLDLTNRQPLSVMTSVDLVRATRTRTPHAKVFIEPFDSPVLTIVGDDSNYGPQVTILPAATTANRDYAIEIPVKIEHGRMRISVGDTNSTYASAIIEPIEGKVSQEQPVTLVRLPFIAGHEPAQIDFNNEASSPRPLVHIGTVKLYELGPARLLWTRYPRLLIHGIQKLFLTAIVLPLAVLGLAILLKRKEWGGLIILAVVPIYYFCVQSVFHTEYRYVLAINYFLFAFAGVSIWWIGKLALAKISPSRFGRAAREP